MAKFRSAKTIISGDVTVEIGRRNRAVAFKIHLDSSSTFIVAGQAAEDLADALDDAFAAADALDDAFAAAESDPLLWENGSQ